VRQIKLRDFPKSRAVAWLFFFTVLSAISSEGIQLGESRQLPMPLPGVRGISLAFGAGGELVELTGPISRLLVWNETEAFAGEFQSSQDHDVSPVDICSNGGFGFLSVDPVYPSIIQFGRRGELFPPIPLDARNLIEPVSICVGDAGRVYLLNRLDGDIWRVEKDGKSSPLMIPTPLRVWKENSQINFDYPRDLIWILKGANLYSTSTGGEARQTISLPLKSTTDFALDDELIWVIGDGLATVDSKTGQAVMVWPSDSLSAWGASRPVSIAVHSHRLALLCDDGRIVIKDLL